MDKDLIGVSKGLRGEISMPGDKSISHRAVMLGAISQGETHVTGFLNGADCLSTIECFRKMGVEIRLSPDETEVWIQGKGLHGLSAPSETLDCGNSGTTTRLMSGILAAQNFQSRVTGDESIQKRPMKRIMTPLSMMGAQIESEKGNDCAPLLISGKTLKAIHYQSPVASAQVKSAILFAGLYAEGETVITEPSLSRDHSERMLRALGASVDTEILADGRAEIRIQKTEELHAFSETLEIPGDISAAAYFISAALMVPDSDLTIKNVGVNPTRDGIIRVYQDMGADIQLLNQRIVGGEEVSDIRVRYSKLHGTTVAGNIIPTLIDELPVVAVVASRAEGKTIIKDATELKVKESNRIDVMCRGLRACGVDAVETEDGMEIIGQGEDLKLHSATIESHNDHRIAMSFAILSLCMPRAEKLCIKDAECIRISFPDFFEKLDSIAIEKRK